MDPYRSLRAYVIDLRQFGLVIDLHEVISTCPLQVSKIDLPQGMSRRADIHNARWSAGLQHIQEQLGEQERSQVIGCEVEL
jgi:hypothetical protein